MLTHTHMHKHTYTHTYTHTHKHTHTHTYYSHTQTHIHIHHSGMIYLPLYMIRPLIAVFKNRFSECMSSHLI